MDKKIAIFGSGDAKPGDGNFETAYRLGKLLAEEGFTVINGGYGGIMLASSKGAFEAGGTTIGVTCKAFGRGGANEYTSRQIEADTLDERLDTLLSQADAYIVLPGSTGTLLELAKAWELKNKGFIKKGKSIILLGEFWRPLIDIITQADAGSGKYINKANEPQEALEILKRSL